MAAPALADDRPRDTGLALLPAETESAEPGTANWGAAFLLCAAAIVAVPVTPRARSRRKRAKDIARLDHAFGNHGKSEDRLAPGARRRDAARPAGPLAYVA